LPSNFPLHALRAYALIPLRWLFCENENVGFFVFEGKKLTGNGTSQEKNLIAASNLR